MSYHCMTKMKNRLLVLILIPLLNKMHSLDAYTKACNSSVQTVKRVETCPSSVSSYKKAAKEKNCSSLAGKALECQSFEYHCVLSDDRKYAIEVCAPSINIVGSVCAKFSTNLTGIIRIDDFDCTKCPYSYNSTTAFEYSECYANITLPFTTDSSQNSTVTTTSKENDAVIFDVVSTSNPNDEDIIVHFVLRSFLFECKISVKKSIYFTTCKSNQLEVYPSESTLCLRIIHSVLLLTGAT